MIQDSIHKNYSFIVVGGGMSGICAAIAAARQGLSTAIIQNRPVLGGNASSEIRMHICGADNHGKRKNARETGILEEILLENKYRNPNYDYPIFDSILWEKVHFQDNLDLYLNTHMTQASVIDRKITSISAHQLTTEKVYTFTGDYFADMTGDATLSALAGAEYMIGREASSTFNEPHAPMEADNICMGNTLLFRTLDTGRHVPFIKPQWANTYTEEDLKHREHGATGFNYWWIELGGDMDHTIKDGELIRDDLVKALYGVWDHIKNGGDHGADNYSLDWVGFLPGKRESRRVIGDYILTENDLAGTRHFEDVVAYGGWPMDMHIPGGLRAKLEPTEFIQVPDVYEIPYRCLIAKDLDNLFIGGRIISASHMAFGSTRVMGTCAVIGQAIGSAASIIHRNGETPRDLYTHIKDLQQLLLREDAYIPNITNQDPADQTGCFNIIASSTSIETNTQNMVDGYGRDEGDTLHHWSSGVCDKAMINLTSQEPVWINRVDLKFDSDLSTQIMISMFDNGLHGQSDSLPKELIKDYKIEFYHKGQLVESLDIKDNHYRFRSHQLDQGLLCDQVILDLQSTHGHPSFKVFEIRIY